MACSTSKNSPVAVLRALIDGQHEISHFELVAEEKRESTAKKRQKREEKLERKADKYKMEGLVRYRPDMHTFPHGQERCARFFFYIFVCELHPTIN